MRVYLRLSVLAVLCTVLSVSCISMAEVSSVSEIGPDEVVVVGRILLDPPLQEHEQKLSWSMGAYRNKVIFLLGDRLYTPDEVGLSEAGFMVRADLEKTFYARVKRRPELVFSAPRVLLDDVNYMELPGGLEVNVPDDSRFVYLGTLIYSRDAYSSITAVEYKDEFEQLKKEVAEKFGPELELSRAEVKVAE